MYKSIYKKLLIVFAVIFLNNCSVSDYTDLWPTDAEENSEVVIREIPGDSFDPEDTEEIDIVTENPKMLTLHIQNNEDSKFSYDGIKDFLGSNDINFSDEGGWFKIFLEEADSFLFVNGLNPGKFIPEEDLLETPIMTLIYAFKNKANSVSAFSKMIEITQLIAEHFESEILDSDRNILTKQMVDHYSQIAEEFDLNNLT